MTSPTTYRGIPAVTAEPASSVDFEIVNSFGVTIATSPDEDLAKAGCRRLLVRFPDNGLTVVRVERTVTRTVVYRPRLLRSVP
jgi:hypothetical protein